jgi:long-subunit acyl-CoA synthetase (AMP-forming)
MVLLSEEARDELERGGSRSELEQELAEELDSVNAECESHEKVAFVVVVREPWTMENGMLTPTMKIKRNVIEDFYNRKMDEWFEQKRKVIWEF